MSTILKYLDDTLVSVGSGTILDIHTNGNGTGVILDSTIFYPQGGGQAADKGTIRSAAFEFAVSDVRNESGDVIHFGRTVSGTPSVGDSATLLIDEKLRNANSRLQSGGHLLLNAMWNSGYQNAPLKGFHFPEGPYVEFEGALPDDADVVVPRLQAEVDRLIALDLPVSARVVQADQLAILCKHVPGNVPTDRPTRIVTIDGYAQPCGGTHVPSLGALSGMRVAKVRFKKGVTRVSYAVA